MWTKLNSLAASLMIRVQLKREEGQALVEYTLILALISVVAVATLTTLGKDVLKELEKVVEKF
jgi:Flp pilus assembly pilin Flp